MFTWSIERVICDTARAVKGTAAMFGLFLPPLTEPTSNLAAEVCRAHREKVCIVCDEDSDALWTPADGAEQLTDREAEEEVSEPSPTNGQHSWPQINCDSCGHPTQWQILKSADDGASWICPSCVKEALASEAEWDAVNGNDEARERIGEVDDFVADPTPRAKRTAAQFYKATPCGPQLTDDELVAVRGLIQERYEDKALQPGIETHACAHYHEASIGGICLACGRPRNEHGAPVPPQQQTSAHPPAPDSPAGGSPPNQHPPGTPNDRADYLGTYHAPAGPDLAAGYIDIGHECFGVADGSILCWRGRNYVPQKDAATGGPDLATWLEPAVMTVLDKHAFTGVVCGSCDCGEPYDSTFSWFEWCEHVAPLIAKHIAQALPDYPDPQQKGK